MRTILQLTFANKHLCYSTHYSKSVWNRREYLLIRLKRNTGKSYKAPICLNIQKKEKRIIRLYVIKEKLVQ